MPFRQKLIHFKIERKKKPFKDNMNIYLRNKIAQKTIKTSQIIQLGCCKPKTLQDSQQNMLNLTQKIYKAFISKNN